MECSRGYSDPKHPCYQGDTFENRMCYSGSNDLKSDLMIFVGGLESKTTNQDLLEYFGCFGVIRFCEAQCWRNNPAKCRGFAIIDVGDYPTFENILMTPHRLNGRQIEVKKLIHDKKELREQTNETHERKIFVSCLPKKLNDIELSDYFSQFGPVELAYIIKHHRDGKSKGFGFVCFYDKTSKQKALAMAQGGGIHINGKTIVCSSYSAKLEKKERKENQSIQENSPEDMDSSNSGTVKEKMKSAGYKSQRSMNKKDRAQIVNHDNNSLQLKNSIPSFALAGPGTKSSRNQSLDNLQMIMKNESNRIESNGSQFNLFLGVNPTSSSMIKKAPIRLLESAKGESDKN